MKSSMKIARLLLLLWSLPAAAAEPSTAPRKVVVGTYINHVHSIDMKGNQFVVDFYVWFRWDGDDLKPLESFELPDGRITSKTGITKKKIGEQNYAACRVLATITKFWDLRRYPRDNHTLSVEIEDAEHEDRELVYEADSRNAGLGASLEVPGWVVTGSTSRSPPRATARTTATRRCRAETSRPTRATASSST